MHKLFFISSLLGKSHNARELLALNKLKRGAATGGDVAELLGRARNLLEERNGVATTGDGGASICSTGDDFIEHREGALGEGGHLEDALRAVPEDGLGSTNDRGVVLDRL